MRVVCLVFLLAHVDVLAETKQTSVSVFLVRHAEKKTGNNPELTDQGLKRALDLARTLKDVKLTSIFSTAYKRTQQTAEPTAKQFDLPILDYDPKSLEDFAARLKSTPGTHLVVGHSNTTPLLVALLGGNSGSEINEAREFDRLYLIEIINDSNISSHLLRYGEASKYK